MAVKIYTMPTCGICKVMKSKMCAKGIDFEEYNLVDYMDELNVMSAPVLMVDEEIYTSPTQINNWINQQ